MKAYGFDQLPKGKKDDFAFPDLNDLKVYGRKSSAGYLPKKNGKHGCGHNSAGKRRARRLIKKLARRVAKKEISY